MTCSGWPPPPPRTNTERPRPCTRDRRPLGRAMMTSVYFDPRWALTRGNVCTDPPPHHLKFAHTNKANCAGWRLAQVEDLRPNLAACNSAVRARPLSSARAHRGCPLETRGRPTRRALSIWGNNVVGGAINLAESIVQLNSVANLRLAELWRVFGDAAQILVEFSPPHRRALMKVLLIV